MHISAYWKSLSLIVVLFAMVSACNHNVTTVQPASVEPATTSSNAMTSPLTTLNDMGAITDFSLTDQNKRPVTLADLKGQVWIADFFFTNCVGVCPMMTAHMAKWNKSLVPEGLRLLSISVDPEHDTSEKLTEYGKQFGATDGKWLFLTGDKAKIIELSTKGFKLSASEDPSSHSQRFVLIDRNGHIRGYYRSDEPNDLAQLEQNARILLKN